MQASTSSPLDMDFCSGSGTGISDAFLGAPLLSPSFAARVESSSTWYRTRFGRRPCFREVRPVSSSSPDGRPPPSGSSSLASWSTRSPVSLHKENSEPAELLESTETRRPLSPCFSSRSSSLEGGEGTLCVFRGELEKVWRGMLAGRLEEGILPVVRL